MRGSVDVWLHRLSGRCGESRWGCWTSSGSSSIRLDLLGDWRISLRCTASQSHGTRKWSATTCQARRKSIMMEQGANASLEVVELAKRLYWCANRKILTMNTAVLMRLEG